LYLFNVFFSFYSGHCSYYGAWGNATLGGKTLQMRAFDWDMDANIQEYPVITVYHPRSPKLGHTFTNIAWAGIVFHCIIKISLLVILLGYIGVFSGMSSTLLGMTSIGVELPDDTWGDESRIGLPFIFVSRYILQYSETVDDALSYITNVHRMCHLIIGIADGKLKTARMIQYSHSKVNYFDDLNLQPLAEWHPRIPNVVYDGMDWQCPSYQYKMYQQITAQYGQITPESTIQNITAVVQTGNLHVAVYDLTDNILYVANGHGVNQSKPIYGYQRQFFRLDLNVEYARIQPSMN
jgi:hypothetical protein